MIEFGHQGVTFRHGFVDVDELVEEHWNTDNRDTEVESFSRRKQATMWNEEEEVGVGWKRKTRNKNKITR